jgi:hypothetical protein
VVEISSHCGSPLKNQPVTRNPMTDIGNVSGNNSSDDDDFNSCFDGSSCSSD